MNTEKLEELAWEARDKGEDVYTYRHHNRPNVIVCVEVNGKGFENDFLDEELDSEDSRQDRGWRE